MKWHKLSLRAATETDCKDLWKWRNCSDVRRNFFDNRYVLWQTHKKWFFSKFNNRNVKIYIAESEGFKIGVIRFEIKKKFVTVSVNLNPSFFGRGLGVKVVKLGSKRFYLDTEESRPIIAEIRKENVVSQKTFSKAGYEYAGNGKDKVIYKAGSQYEQC